MRALTVHTIFAIESLIVMVHVNMDMIIFTLEEVKIMGVRCVPVKYGK